MFLEPKPGTFAAILFAIALAPRLLVAHAFDGSPAWDGRYYHIGAKSIAAGLGYAGETGAPWCHYPVGYSALIGGAYRLFGSEPIVATTVNAVVGALLACCTYQLARRATSEGRARIAGLLAALHPGLLLYTALVMTEPVAALALVASALVAAHTRASNRGAALAGLVLGLGTLVRPQSLLLAPFLGLFVPRERWALRPLLRAGAIATLTTLMVVSPWTLRNCRVMDGCALVSTNAGWNLAIGAFPRATGRFETLVAGDGCHVVTGQVQQDRCWVDLGLGWIADDPARWLGLIPRKLGFTFDHESFPVGYLAEMEPERWPEERRRIGRGVLTWTHRALLAAAAFGLLLRPSRARPITLVPPFLLGLWVWFAAASPDHPFWLVALALLTIAALRHRALEGVTAFAVIAVASVALTHAVFFGEDRYHLVVTPFFCVLAAMIGASTSPRSATSAVPSPPAP